MTEADTCRELVTPKIVQAGWSTSPFAIGEQRTFTNGRIFVAGGKVRRGKQRRADYILFYRRDFPLAVVEAKEASLPAETGVQQAREYAEALGLKFAYATNGHRIIEIDYLAGTEREVSRYATPDELFARLSAGVRLPPAAAPHLLEPFNLASGKVPRYYQQIAIHRVIEAILLGQTRILATLATGTGKTCVAFQICWTLWNSRWNRTGEYRRPKILFLADRNILVDDPMAKMFAPFGDARHKIAGGDVSQGRDMYFGIYQALTTASAEVFRQYRPDFFDLIIIDECHRGSSRDESAWRAVLDYFEPAVQFGMTATPLREDSRDTYDYFGNPIYTYSLRQGIEDGFLAPYRVHRVITTVDAAGWRPSKDELDRFGRIVPDDEYETKDFERVVALRSRTKAIARHLSDFLKGTDRFAKTLIFCVDQEHAAEMRQELVNLNSDLVQQYPDYICRVTADESAIGLTHLANFQDVDKPTPVILTTSQLLTTGVDAEMVKNVVLARVVGSRAEFKQIVGRGTRLKVDYGKEYFNIIDFTGTATRHFADPDFDGDPARIEEVLVDEAGKQVEVVEVVAESPEQEDAAPLAYEPPAPGTGMTVNEPWVEYNREPRKYYIDGGEVEVIGHLVYDLDTDGKKLQVVKYTEYSGRAVRTLYPTREALQSAWADPDTRSEVLRELTERGISFEELAATSEQPDADPFDLLCHLAWNAPLLTRRQRAEQARRQQDVQALMLSCDELGVPAALEISRSGHGAHAWVFFSSLVSARDARRLGTALISHTCARTRQLKLTSYDRLFPNQDTMPTRQTGPGGTRVGGFGNLIALPLQKRPRESGCSVFVDRAMRPHPDQWAFLAGVLPMAPHDIEPTILRATGGVHPLDVTFIDEEDLATPWERQATTTGKLPGTMPKALTVTLANLVYFEKSALPQALANRLIRLAAFQNPEFYKAQAMRMSVWDKPRVIGKAENYPQHIALPRGCLDAARALLMDNGIACELKDERFTGEPIRADFVGTLRPDQELAVTTMLQHDAGVLCAPTAFGKTVTAAAIIARRGVNTLVLVHRTELLKQWQERLQAFLGAGKEMVGTIGGGKSKPTGRIDIAVMQSLSRQGEVNALVENYGQIVVDECHHVGAASFDAILKRTKAKFVLGLTGTPIRRDGQQPIIFMQCGPIRHTAARPESAPHDLEVVPRSRFARIDLAASAGIQDVFRHLANDLARTQAIAAEAAAAFGQGRKVLVLTERTEHLDAILLALNAQVPPPFVLHGRMSKKQRAALITALDALPPDAPRILLATGKLVGEGFDHPPLDTLVLAMPVSWKGTLQQYAGRLHREHASKADVRVIDFVDTGHPALLRMWDKRQRGYRAMGYRMGVELNGDEGDLPDALGLQGASLLPATRS